jgi:hypothetical protein
VRKRKGLAKKKVIVMSDSEEVESPTQELTRKGQDKGKRNLIVISDSSDDGDHAPGITVCVHPFRTLDP